jgi:hypothetical protein
MLLDEIKSLSSVLDDERAQLRWLMTWRRQLGCARNELKRLLPLLPSTSADASVTRPRLNSMVRAAHNVQSNVSKLGELAQSPELLARWEFMDTPDSYSLRVLAQSVKEALFNLPEDLDDGPSVGGPEVSVLTAVRELSKMLDTILYSDPANGNGSALRLTLSSLRAVEGSMQLLIAASQEYDSCNDRIGRHDIEDTWMGRKIRLLDQMVLCYGPLEALLGVVDTLGLQSGGKESDEGMGAGSNLPDGQESSGSPGEVAS